MLHYAAVFFVIALIAALFGFGGIAASAVGIAKILFIVFAVLAVERSLDAVRDSSQQLRDQVHRASDGTLGYVWDEPLKSMLFAAAHRSGTDGAAQPAGQPTPPWLSAEARPGQGRKPDLAAFSRCRAMPRC
jgi:uncharacterized membrane protein YtjA (UPF0391 family)